MRKDSDQYHNETTAGIANLLIGRSRTQLLKQCDLMNCKTCSSFLDTTIRNFVIHNKTIQFILPAFPAKSPNSQKTASHLPDLGEKLALIELNKLCQMISSFYLPGAQILICSDGTVFNDLLGVTDTDVKNYTRCIKEIIDHHALSNLKLYNLESYYSNLTLEQMRLKLLTEFGEDLQALQSRTKMNENHQQLFNGIHRFIYEDLLTINTDQTKNQLRLLAKQLTYLVIQRSNAWSNLIESVNQNAVRLSIHPQVCGSKKFGIALLKSDNKWATPWHRVVLQNYDEFSLIKREQAESLQAKKIFINGRFSHYILARGV